MRSCRRNSATPGVRRCDRTFRITSRWDPKASACLAKRTTSRSTPTQKDKWGIPALHIVASYGENEKAMAKAMRQDIGAILNELKLEQVTPPADEISVFGKNIHECGTARMGDNPKTSVVDRNCKVHHVPNLFVSDGAVFPTQSCYEPTLTIMAISARAGEHIAESFRRGEL